MVNLTIGGGNFKGISYVGALEYLYLNNLLNKIENFHGSSVGSIIGTLFIIGYKPFEIFNILLNLNFQDCWDLNLNNIENSYSLITDRFFKEIEKVISLKEDSNITFIQFYEKYNININLYATSLTTRKNTCFNYINYPNVKVFSALQASCSIPIIFPPVIIDNEYFVDGCLKCIDGVSADSVNLDTVHFIIRANYMYKQISSFTEYIAQILNCALQNEDIIDTEYTINITISKEYRHKYNFNDIQYNDKIKLFHSGIIQAKEKLHHIIPNILERIINETKTEENEPYSENENLENKNLEKDIIENDINNEAQTEETKTEETKHLENEKLESKIQCETKTEETKTEKPKTEENKILEGEIHNKPESYIKNVNNNKTEHVDNNEIT